MARSLCLITTLLVLSLFTAATTTLALGRKEVAVYTVTSYGAKKPKGGGGSSMEDSLKSAWLQACKSDGPATINVADSVFNEGPVIIDGTDCRNPDVITFDMEGTTHLAPDYTKFGEAEQWIKLYHVNNVSIKGGTLDAGGGSLYECKAGGGDCPDGATTFAIHNSVGVTITGLTLKNSQMFHMAIVDSSKVLVEGITIEAPGDSPNTDGIHISGSNKVTITGTNTIATGDDCISIGQGCDTVTVEGVNCGPGHGISIGSLGKYAGEKPVQHITVHNVEFHETKNGARIKSFASEKPCLVNDVVFQKLRMDGVENPLIIDQNYGSSAGDSSVQIQDVRFLDITGSSASKDAVSFQCSGSLPCKRIELSGVHLTYNDQKPLASCSHVQLVGNAPCNNVFL